MKNPLPKYAACFTEPSDAKMLADTIARHLRQLGPHQLGREGGQLLIQAEKALRVLSPPPANTADYKKLYLACSQRYVRDIEEGGNFWPAITRLFRACRKARGKK